MSFEVSFEIDGDLIFVAATVVGPDGDQIVQLVLDTGSVLTTIVPGVAGTIGYTADQRVARSLVRTATGVERGYIVRLSTLSTLGFTLTGVHANIAELGHGIDGVLGMNVLSDFNFEVRPDEQRIRIERISRRAR